MRIAHISDLHIARSLSRGDYNPKRLLGYVNYRLFRSRLYPEHIAREALERLMERPPDAVLLTGDISQHGLDAEFDAAEALLSPVKEAGIPVIAVAGNHDIYGRGKQRRLSALIETLAAPAHPDRRGIYHFPGVEILPLSQGIPTPLFFSHGLQRSGELHSARELWSEPPAGVMRLVCGHYPVVDPHGGRLLYFRGLRQAEKLMEFCARSQVAGYFCGHNHKRFSGKMRGNCVQYAAPALSAVRRADREWVSVYECGPELEHPRDEVKNKNENES